MNIVNGSTPTLMFLMVSSTDRATAQTGLDPVPTVKLSKAGGTLTASTNAPTEVGEGLYKVTLTASETGTDGQLAIVATADGCATWREFHEVYTTIPVAMAAGETVFLATAEFNKLADTIWRRHTDDIESSADGDTVHLKSPLGAISKLVHDLYREGATLYIAKSDGSSLGTQTIAVDAEGQPIGGLTTN